MQTREGHRRFKEEEIPLQQRVGRAMTTVGKAKLFEAKQLLIEDEEEDSTVNSKKVF